MSFYIYVSTPVLSIYEQMTYPSPSLSASVSLSSKYMNPWAIMPSMSHLVFMCSPMHADAVHTCSVIVQQISPGFIRASRMLRGGAANAERGSARKTRGLAICTSVAC